MRLAQVGGDVVQRGDSGGGGGVRRGRRGRRRGPGAGRVVGGGRGTVVADAARDAERGDEHVEQHDEVEQVGGHVLPERDAPERRPLLPVLVLLLHDTIPTQKR